MKNLTAAYLLTMCLVGAGQAAAQVQQADQAAAEVGVWSPHEKGWIVESNGVTKDGTESSATEILSPKDYDTLLWRSVDRALGENLLPDTPMTTLRRKKT